MVRLAAVRCSTSAFRGLLFAAAIVAVTARGARAGDDFPDASPGTRAIHAVSPGDQGAAARQVSAATVHAHYHGEHSQGDVCPQCGAVHEPEGAFHRWLHCLTCRRPGCSSTFHCHPSPARASHYLGYPHYRWSFQSPPTCECHGFPLYRPYDGYLPYSY